MKKTLLTKIVAAMIILSGTAAFAQTLNTEAAQSEVMHKSAVDAGDHLRALNIEKQLESSLPEGSVTSLLGPTPGMEEAPERDWYATDALMHQGNIRPTADSGKTIDMKYGDDGIVYSAVAGTPSPGFYNSLISFYRSTDNGGSWTYLFGYIYTGYVGSISLLVESRNNSVPDSARLILFYTYSANSNLTDAGVNYISRRAGGAGASTGLLASPPAGKKFSHVSALSDGAYYANATYYGAVFTESDNVPAFLGITKTRYYRTINWGGSWSNSTLTTGSADYFPSAGYKEGNSDSVYIAVERRVSSQNIDIVFLRTSFAPATAYNAFTAFGGWVLDTASYRLPCLAIRQTNPSAHMMITLSKDHGIFHSDSPTGSIGFQYITYINTYPSYSKLTNVTSSMDQTYPYTVVSIQNDSIIVDKLSLEVNYLGTRKVNSHKASGKVVPLAACAPGNVNLTTVAYASANTAGDSIMNVYADYEGNKTLNLKLSMQGLHNAAQNRLNMKDTVKITLRRWFQPDSVMSTTYAILDSASLTATVNYPHLTDSYYYVVINHRNSLETWTKPFYINTPVVNYDLTTAADKAFGNNLIFIDSSPAVYALYSGDVNQDGSIDAIDLGMIDNHTYAFATGYLNTDLNGDGFVDASDMIIADNNAANYVEVVRP